MTHSVVEGDELFPFAVTTVAAKSPGCEKESVNCQDAVGLCITPQFVAGVVCDGAGGTHTAFDRHSGSNNEVGAKLACSIVLRDVQAAFARDTKFVADELVGRITGSLLGAFKSTVNAFCAHDEGRAEKFIYDFLMTTVLGFVVTNEKFVVFHSGDGVIGVNGKFNILESEEGRYFSNGLLAKCCPGRFAKLHSTNHLKIFASGETKELQNICVATDGMASFVKQHERQLSEFIQRPPPRHQCERGFDFALQEFRRDIAWNPEISLELNDDAAFALIRRISTTSEAQC